MTFDLQSAFLLGKLIARKVLAIPSVASRKRSGVLGVGEKKLLGATIAKMHVSDGKPNLPLYSLGAFTGSIVSPITTLSGRKGATAMRHPDVSSPSPLTITVAGNVCACYDSCALPVPPFLDHDCGSYCVLPIWPGLPQAVVTQSANLHRPASRRSPPHIQSKSQSKPIYCPFASLNWLAAFHGLDQLQRAMAGPAVHSTSQVPCTGVDNGARWQFLLPFGIPQRNKTRQ